MKLVNRCAALVKPRRPYLEWMKSVSSEVEAEAGFPLTLDEPHLYRLPEHDDLTKALQKVWRQIMQEWFEVDLCSMVEDLGADQLWSDEPSFAEALSAFEKDRIGVVLTKYCEQRIPAHIRNELRLDYEFDGDSVTLVEVRPAFRSPGEFTRGQIAQFRRTSSSWLLYCSDQHLEWHLYDPFPESTVFEELLAAVDRDETGIFYG